MHITNDKPAGAPAFGNEGPFAWKGGDTVEVPDEFAAQLLAIADSGFRVPEGKHVHAEVDPAETLSEVDPAGEVTEPRAKPRSTRK